MKMLVAATLTIASLLFPAISQADEVYCPAVRATAHLTSEGDLGVNIGQPLGEPPVFEPVEPGDCFYDAALEDMKSVCGAFIEDPSSVDSGVEDGGVPQSKAQMRQAISRLKKRVRSLRRQLLKRQKP